MDDGFAGFTIGVAGLGLIGGSLAKAFHNSGHAVCGYDRDVATIKAAKETKIFEDVSDSPKRVLSCDLIFIALYPDGIINFVTDNLSRFKKGAVIIDCSGIKSQVCAEVFAITQNADFTFIGGHPMAGTEQSGFAASTVSLFNGASFILTPRDGENKDLLEQLRVLLKSAGFGKVVVTTPQHHDRMIAFTSQLPHVIACAYVMSPSCPEHQGYSAGSFRDVSRVAHINPPLWAELFTGNRKELCEEIDLLIENMSRIRNAAANADTETLTSLLQEARERKDSV